MTQLTLAEADYARKKRKTRCEVFLEKMDSLIPWKQLEKKIKRHYHTGKTSRPPYPMSTMLRVHWLQLFYNLSDPAMEDALYEIELMGRFAGLRPSDRLSDETTINFRHLLERHRNQIMNDIAAGIDNRELSTKEAASLLGLSPSALRKWRCTGERPGLPWCKRFRKVLHLESQVIFFKEENTTSNCEETYV